MILYAVRALNDLYEIENDLKLLNPAASRRVLAAIKSKSKTFRHSQAWE
jgi:plasmid stabilization system protein ParE